VGGEEKMKKAYGLYEINTPVNGLKNNQLKGGSLAGEKISNDASRCKSFT